MLGIKITIDEDNYTIKLDQKQAIIDLLKEYQVDREYVYPVPTLVYPYTKLTKNHSPVTDKEKEKMNKLGTRYRSLVGSLMYIMLGTRPDIAYAVSNLSKYVSNPGIIHWRAAIYCLRYLKGTIDICISYKRSTVINLNIDGFSDSDWAGCQDSRRSQSGGVIFMAGGPISWISQQQASVTLSSAEAELNALVIVIKEVLWLRRMLVELQLIMNSVITSIYVDNTSAIVIAKTGVTNNKKTKHIELYYNFIKDEIQIYKSIELLYVNTKENIADIFTKAVVSVREFTNMRDIMFNSEIINKREIVEYS
jgi:hypothetical protein